jgi:thiamine-phosphate pyrophosphorylase
VIPRVVQITGLPLAELWSRIDRGGADLAVQLRSPELSTRALYALGQELRARTRRVGAMLWVNDRLDLALLLEADGIHLGRRSIAAPEARRVLGSILVTRSVHDERELEAARAEGADAALVSPIFPSPDKGEPLGLEAIVAMRRLAPELPLIALGGVTLENARRCLAAGASAVASIRHDLTALHR